MDTDRATTAQLRGLRLQVIGLAVLLAAMTWQNFFSDWFDKTATEWQYFIQAEVQSATAHAVNKLASAMAAPPGEARQRNLVETANSALQDLASITLERDAQRARAERRSLALKWLRFALFAAGAVILLAGVAIARRPRAG